MPRKKRPVESSSSSSGDDTDGSSDSEEDDKQSSSESSSEASSKSTSESSSDSEESEDEEEKGKKRKPVPKANAAKKAKLPIKKKPAKQKKQSSSEEDDDSEDISEDEAEEKGLNEKAKRKQKEADEMNQASKQSSAQKKKKKSSVHFQEEVNPLYEKKVYRKSTFQRPDLAAMAEEDALKDQVLDDFEPVRESDDDEKTKDKSEEMNGEDKNDSKKDTKEGKKEGKKDKKGDKKDTKDDKKGDKKDTKEDKKGDKKDTKEDKKGDKKGAKEDKKEDKKKDKRKDRTDKKEKESSAEREAQLERQRKAASERAARRKKVLKLLAAALLLVGVAVGVAILFTQEEPEPPSPPPPPCPKPPPPPNRPPAPPLTPGCEAGGVYNKDFTICTHIVFLDINIETVGTKRVFLGLFGYELPKTVDNFLWFIDDFSEFTYKGTEFYAVPDILAMAGDFENGDGTGTKSYWGPPFEDESFEFGHNGPGTLSMANGDKPNNNGHNFQISFYELQMMNGDSVVFGRVLDGWEIIDAMKQFENGPFSKPKKKITIVNAGNLELKGRFCCPLPQFRTKQNGRGYGEFWPFDPTPFLKSSIPIDRQFHKTPKYNTDELDEVITYMKQRTEEGSTAFKQRGLLQSPRKMGPSHLGNVTMNS